MTNQSTLETIFTHNDGILYWKKSGKIAGSCNGNGGYIRIVINGKKFYRHRLIWIMFNGDIPNKMVIDHINGKPGDDRIDNLQCIYHKENIRKKKMQKSNTSGYRGMVFEKERNKWQSKIEVDGKIIHLGRYDTKEDAAIAYNIAAITYFKEFANLNIIN